MIKNDSKIAVVVTRLANTWTKVAPTNAIPKYFLSIKFINYFIS